MRKEELVVEPSDIKVAAHEYQPLVERGLQTLSEPERRAIFLRFWHACTIAEVADQMTLSWEDADRLIDCAVAKMRAAIKGRQPGVGKGVT